MTTEMTCHMAGTFFREFASSFEIGFIILGICLIVAVICGVITWNVSLYMIGRLTKKDKA